jgi:hypothetical protein
VIIDLQSRSAFCSIYSGSVRRAAGERAERPFDPRLDLAHHQFHRAHHRFVRRRPALERSKEQLPELRA